MDEESTYGLSPERLARLLGIGEEGPAKDRAEGEQAAGRLLRARLEGTLPLESKVVDALPAVLGHLCRELLPLKGRPLGDVLLDPTVEIEAIKELKDYGKKLARRSRSEAEKASAVAIYYAAIASALLFHDEKISGHSYKSLKGSFSMLIGKEWMVPELARHFSKAHKACGNRGG